jgi:transcriptional regulator with XRE-family HTH domain
MTRAHDDVDRKLGVAIRLARKRYKLTQTQLGDALGVTFQQIQKYERGTNAVASTRIPALCRVLKISPNDLFDFRGQSAQPAQISSWAAGIALRLDELHSKGRNAIAAMLDALEA